MARRSLRPNLNQIRGWVRQGRTDAWIAHQLEVTVQQIQAFKKEHGLLPDGEDAGSGPDFDDEIDLRAEDDALIAAELEAAEAARREEEARRAEEEAARAAEAGGEAARRREGGRGRAARRRRPRARPRRRRRRPAGARRKRRRRSRGAVAAAGARARRPRPRRSRAPSTTARRVMGCGSTPPSPTTPSTPSTGRATGRSP